MSVKSDRISLQTGSALLESLIGVLLLSILLAGLTTVLSRTLVSQRYMNTHNIAVLQMRERLFKQGVSAVCADTDSVLPIGQFSLSMVSASCSSRALPTVGVHGQQMAFTSGQIPAISVAWTSAATSSNSALVGGDGVITIAY